MYILKVPSVDGVFATSLEGVYQISSSTEYSAALFEKLQGWVSLLLVHHWFLVDTIINVNQRLAQIPGWNAIILMQQICTHT